jgi:hypothetical protein
VLLYHGHVAIQRAQCYSCCCHLSRVLVESLSASRHDQGTRAGESAKAPGQQGLAISISIQSISARSFLLLPFLPARAKPAITKTRFPTIRWRCRSSTRQDHHFSLTNTPLRLHAGNANAPPAAHHRLLQPLYMQIIISPNSPLHPTPPIAPILPLRIS